MVAIRWGRSGSDSPCEVNKGSYFYIENVFEELDAPGEWYMDHDEGILYFMPPADLDLGTLPRLKSPYFSS